MSVFSEVLSAIESEGIARSETPHGVTHRGPAVDLKARPDMRRSSTSALAAYSQFRRGDDRPIHFNPAPPLSAAEFYKKLVLANGSRDALRALRRETAWLLHPDRVDAGSAPDISLAQCNSEIDAALERLGASSVE